MFDTEYNTKYYGTILKKIQQLHCTTLIDNHKLLV